MKLITLLHSQTFSHLTNVHTPNHASSSPTPPLLADAIPSAEFDLQLADIMRRQAVVTDAGCRSASTTNGAGLPANSDKAAILAQYAACEVSDDEDEYPFSI